VDFFLSQCQLGFFKTKILLEAGEILLFHFYPFVKKTEGQRVLNQLLTIYVTLGAQVFLEIESLIKWVRGMRGFFVKKHK